MQLKYRNLKKPALFFLWCAALSLATPAHATPTFNDATRKFAWTEDLNQTTSGTIGGEQNPYGTKTKLSPTHFIDIREAIDYISSNAQCGAAINAWSEADTNSIRTQIGASRTTIQSSHINVLRAAIRDLYTLKGRAVNIPANITTSVTRGDRIFKSHIQDMRDALDGLAALTCVGGGGVIACYSQDLGFGPVGGCDTVSSYIAACEPRGIGCSALNGPCAPVYQGTAEAANCPGGAASGCWVWGGNPAGPPITCLVTSATCSPLGTTVSTKCDDGTGFVAGYTLGCMDGVGEVCVDAPGAACLPNGDALPSLGVCQPGDDRNGPPLPDGTGQCCSGFMNMRCAAFFEPWDLTCVAAPLAAVCGNGATESGEQCDDFNTTNGDGCSSSCQTEAGPGICPPSTGLAPCTLVMVDPFTPCLVCTGTAVCNPNGFAWNRGGLPLLVDEILPTTPEQCCSEEAICYSGTTTCECGNGSGPGGPGAVCGNGTQEIPEPCDLGMVGNGPCPKTCSTLCTTNTCAPTATCFDGIQNQGETGVDCGGPCAACSGGAVGPCGQTECYGCVGLGGRTCARDDANGFFTDPDCEFLCRFGGSGGGPID